MTMTTEAADPVAEEATQEIEETALPTLADIQKQRDEKLQRLESGEPEEQEEPEPEEEPEEEVEEEVETEEEAKETPDVLSQFEEASEEEKEQILSSLKAATGKAFGSQRKEIRELKAKLEAAEAAAKEVQSVASSSDSPFGSIHTEDQADQTIEQIEQNIEKFEDQLIYEPETEYRGDEEVRGIRVNGQFVSVADVRKWAKDQKANIKSVQERKREIRKNAKLFDDEDVEIETLKQELDMSEDEAEAFEKLMSDPSFSVVKTVRPEYAKALFSVFAKSAIAGRKQVKRKAPKAKNEKATPPKGSPSNTKSIVSQKQKLQDIVRGKTGATIQQRVAADRQLRQLLRQGK